MSSSIALSPDERKALLDYRTATPDDPGVAPPRAHVLLAGRRLRLGQHRRRPVLQPAAPSPAGAALPGGPRRGLPAGPAAPARLASRWAGVVAPLGHRRDAARLRVLAQPLALRRAGAAAVAAARLDVSRETVRRWLHRADLVWRRPRPVLRRTGPAAGGKTGQSCGSCWPRLPGDEAAVFEDEVDVNLNPKIGCMWMPKGQQAEVETPGDNAKRYLAGSLTGGPGRLIATGPGGTGRCSWRKHLHELLVVPAAVQEDPLDKSLSEFSMFMLWTMHLL